MLWDGPDPKDRSRYPCSVEFQCKPAPAETLNSLESGRLMLAVYLKGDSANVSSVSAKVTNIAKRKNLDRVVQGSSKLKHQTSLSTNLIPDKNRLGYWTGELSIPASWIEGGTKTYEKTGAASPRTEEEGLYMLEITYRLAGADDRCTASFSSPDVFHWEARSKTTV